ncbi:MAG: DJ-1/PfpI family protein [Enterobacteriaceae bacterium]
MSNKKVAVLLAEGFEEAKTAIVVGIMHRLDIDVEMLTCQDRIEIKGRNNIRMFGDALLERRQHLLYDALIIPGGADATARIASHREAIEFIKHHHQAGKLICTIGSAAAEVLAANRLLQEHHYTSAGDAHLNYDDGVYVDKSLVEDGQFITSKGLGTTLDFALTIAARLTGDQQAVIEQAEQLFYDYAQGM